MTDPLAEIEARCKAAYRGDLQWERDRQGVAHSLLLCMSSDDAVFHAHARTDVERMARALRWCYGCNPRLREHVNAILRGADHEQ